MLRRIAIGLVLALSVALPAVAQDFHRGLAAAKLGDYATALREWRPLAGQGHANAQGNLGQLYRRGLGVSQDYAEAVKWYRKAAEQGVAGSQFNLGAMYQEGHGVGLDYTEAANWYRKAAEQGFAEAQNNLGFLHRQGLGVPQDYVLAHMWFSLAAASGSRKGATNRDAVASFMRPTQIAKAQKLAREWLAKHKKK